MLSLKLLWILFRCEFSKIEIFKLICDIDFEENSFVR